MSDRPPSDDLDSASSDEMEVDVTDVFSLARWLQAQPCNREGTDKTYVLVRYEAMRRFAEQCRNAKRVD